MCGICGVAISNSDGRAVERVRLGRMTDVLAHRGPDDRGVFATPKIGLGHRRLSIVDVAGGIQPMANEDQSIWIVFNGEIYNHRDLRPHLERAGHLYRTNSDTETILHLYEEVGERVVEELTGMFAFAIYDSNRGSVFLARDRLGIKPLYYYIDSHGSLYFGSEIKAILAYGALSARLNETVLPDYLANRAPSGEQTLFEGILRLQPAHVLTWRQGNVENRRYWKVSFKKSLPRRRPGFYIEEFSSLFKESVRLRLMADVPLGMFLSGGIDSSAIAAEMSQLVPGAVKTFSVAFAEREANELEYARLVARRFKTDHHEVIVTPRQFFNALPGLIYHEDEPIAHPSSVPLHFVSKLASEHVKVVLTGEGSDELLAGYAKYWKTVLNLNFASGYNRITSDRIRSLVKKVVGNRSLRALRPKLSRTFLCRETSIEDSYFENFSVFPRAAQAELLSPRISDSVSSVYPYEHTAEAIDSSDAESLLEMLLAADVETYLPELLMKQDQMSMSASIESRVPFLDHRLVEFVCALPADLKLRRFTTKRILRQAMRNRLPEQILRREKMGFPVPVGKWLAGPYTALLDEYLLCDRFAERGLFNSEYVRDLVARHRAGEHQTEKLWMLLNLEIWMRRFIDAEEPIPIELEEALFASAAMPA